MTTTELQLKTKRFTAKMSDKDLLKTRSIIEEMIEDRLDLQKAERICRRIDEGKEKTVPWEKVEAALVKRLKLKAK